MKNINGTKKFLGLLIISLMAFLLGACSDEKPKNVVADKNTAKAKANHVDYGEASESVKQKFETEFSKKCVARELKNSVNKDTDQKRYEEACDCIAKRIAKDLSDVDAEKYLQEHEDTQTLEIKFDDAAYFCVQNKPQPKGPHLFGK